MSQARRIAAFKSSIVLALLIFGFSAFTPTQALVLWLIGTVVLASLACWPARYQPFEAWMCLLVIVAFGAFGAARFIADLPTIHPWDRDEMFRGYVGYSLIAGIAAVLPYVLLRLTFTYGSETASAAGDREKT